jgi:hypothetical protein
VLKGQARFLQASQIGKQLCEPLPGLGGIHIKLDSPVESIEGFIEPAFALQHIAAAQEISRAFIRPEILAGIAAFMTVHWRMSEVAERAR